MPDSVTRIGESSFWGCTSLTSVVIPKNVTFISRFAFIGTGLKNITLPAGYQGSQEAFEIFILTVI